jgi:tRNA G10  N-methylase Trm11
MHALDEDAELAAAEAWAFTGVEPVGRLVHAPLAVDISHSAYLRHCVAVEAQGADLVELVADCHRAGLAYEGFHLEVFRPPPRQVVNGQEVTREVANAITGRPDLSHPRVTLAVVVSDQGWCCGRLVSVGRNRWLQGMERPHHFSSALPQRMARALANLVAGPGQALIDPCCGIGTVVMEAADAGVIAFGSDHNGRMLHFLAVNLEHFGLPRRLFRADARQLTGHFDGAVLDLPYGRNLIGDLPLWRELIAPLRQAARRSVVVAPTLLTQPLGELGFRVVRVARVPKGGLTRYIHLVVPEPS